MTTFPPGSFPPGHPQHDEHHDGGVLPGLLDGVNQTFVGAPFALLPAANVPGVGLAGLGPATTLLKFATDIGKRGGAGARKLGRAPRVATVSVFAVGGSGPITGIVRWGAGNGSQQELEFDIQTGFPLFTVPVPTGSTKASGGSIFALPMTSIEVLARNDANLIPYNGGGVALGLPDSSPLGAPSATASLALGDRGGSSQLTRTVTTYYGGVLAPAGTFTISVPAFAQSYRLFRLGGGAITVQTQDGQANPVDEYALAADVPAPLIALPGSSSGLVVTTAAATLKVLGAIFNLAI